MDEPSKGILNPVSNNGIIGGVTITIEEPEQRGRSRNKLSDVTSTSNITSACSSKSRSASRVSINEQDFLKWTILSRDPSERLHQENKKVISDYEEEQVSNEEQISDIEHDYEIDSELDYDLPTHVLPNFSTSIQHVLDSSKLWIEEYNKSISLQEENKKVSITSLTDGYIRALQYISHDNTNNSIINSSHTNNHNPSHTYIAYLDDVMDSPGEKLYSLTYTFGTIAKNGDTIYVINQSTSFKKLGTSNTNILLAALVKIREHVMFLLDCCNGVIDKLDVVILSLHHPWPKHLLNETIEYLKPSLLITPLQVTLTTLQNFVCNVPTLVIRKKLKRTKKKSIYD